MGCGTSVPAEERALTRERRARAAKVAESMEMNGGRLLVHGVLQRANCRNRNGRVYPKKILYREAERFLRTHVQQQRALGELDHPAPDDPHFRSLNLSNVSHVVLDYTWDEDDLVGTVEVLPTPAGNKLKHIYLSGEEWPGMSSRGWATLKEKDGYVFVLDDFELITFDFVRDPSTEDAVLRPLPHRLPPKAPQVQLGTLPALVQAHQWPDLSQQELERLLAALPDASSAQPAAAAPPKVSTRAVKHKKGGVLPFSMFPRRGSKSRIAPFVEPQPAAAAAAEGRRY